MVHLLLDPAWAHTDEPVIQITEDTVPYDLPASMRRMLIEVFSQFS